MKLHELKEAGVYSADHLEAEKILSYKAGIIPWMMVDGEMKMLFVISSNPSYGGPDPGIIKGGADAGEQPIDTAIREMVEEVGIKPSRLIGTPKLIAADKVTGLTSTYTFHVFGCEVKPAKIKIDRTEIKAVEWLTQEEFTVKGRKSHRQYVDKLVKNK